VTLSVHDELKQEGHEPAVPRSQPRGIKRHALGAWGVIEQLFHVAESGKLVLQPPAAGELDQHRLCGRVAAVQLSATAWLIRYAMHRSSFRPDVGMRYTPFKISQIIDQMRGRCMRRFSRSMLFKITPSEAWKQ
jgi:hypothetical protein